VKVIGLAGSPRHSGNTYALVDHTLQKIEAGGFATQIIELSGRNIQACKGCDACREKGICAIDDDLWPIFEKMLAARSGQNFTHAELLMWFHVRGFYMVGSNYWNVAIGFNQGDVKKDTMAYHTLDRLADNFMNLLHLLRGAS
jgi:hypothetical protein